MKINITARKMDVSDALKERLDKKLSKLDKYFGTNTEANVILLLEKSRQVVEVTVHFSNMIFRAEESSYDMYISIDRVIDMLEHQIRKNKSRLEKKLHASAFVPDVAADAVLPVDEEAEYTIVKNKKFFVKPMSIEEAILQMNLLGHAFYMFKDIDSDKLNTVYKRRNGDYGLIETE